MITLQRRLSVAVLVGLIALSALVATAARPVPLGAEEIPADVELLGELSYRAWDGEGRAARAVDWNVVLGTGNCCESLVRVAADGTIYDFGGNELHLSRDSGASWSRIDTTLVLGAEGDLGIAPNGDVVALTWDPYTGDRIVAVRWTAADRVWRQQEILLNTPFYDRPWLAVVPGADTATGYRVVVRSGYALNPGYLVSDDGLAYTAALRLLASRDPLGPLASSGWVGSAQAQAHRSAGMIPLGDGRLLLAADLALACSSRLHVLEVDGAFSCLGEQAGPLAGWHVMDDRGTLYAAEFEPSGQISLRHSTTQGTTSTLLALPMLGMEVRGDGDLDIKTTADGDRVVIAGHAQDPDGNSHVLVWDLRRVGASYDVTRIVELGRGDGAFGTNASGGTRLDFPSVGILPDGRLVASFRDAELAEMALAIESR